MTYKEENPFPKPFSDMLVSMLNPTKEMQKDFKEQFFVNKFVEVFFDFFKMLKDDYDHIDRLFDESLFYTKKLMEDLKK